MNTGAAARAQELRAQGNAAFKEDRWAMAMTLYQSAAGVASSAGLADAAAGAAAAPEGAGPALLEELVLSLSNCAAAALRAGLPVFALQCAHRSSF